jgi:hypothetical protein
MIGSDALPLHLRALADSQHEILALSTNRPGHPGPRPHRGISIALPFKKWTWSEALRLSPALLQFRPEILHFVQPHQEALEGWTNAMSLLPSLAKSLAIAGGGPAGTGPAVVTSFFDLRGDLRALRPLLLQSHALTASTNAQLERLRRETRGNQEPLLGLTPLDGLELNEDSIDARNEDGRDDSDGLSQPARNRSGTPTASIEALFERADIPVLATQGDFAADTDLAPLFALARAALRVEPSAIFVALGGWGQVNARNRVVLTRSLGENADRFYVTGALLPVDRERLLARANAILCYAGEARPPNFKQSVFFEAEAETSVRIELRNQIRDALRTPAGPGPGVGAEPGQKSALMDSPANAINRLYALTLATHRASGPAPGPAPGPASGPASGR